MAQNTADAPAGRDVLVGGAGAVADARSPALVAIDAGDKPISRRTKLELTLEPAVVADEPYLVVVSLYRRDGPGPRLGTVSFFPPRAGVALRFYFDAAPIAAEIAAARSSRIDLSIALAPAEQRQNLTTSAVRVVGARMIDG